jgi:hypothetical protein
MITIEKINYFGDSDKDFNAKVLYRKYGKLYHATLYIDYFNRRFHIPNQPKECKVLTGLEQAVFKYQF